MDKLQRAGLGGLLFMITIMMVKILKFDDTSYYVLCGVAIILLMAFISENAHDPS